MGRPAGYDHDDALEQAMRLFWDQGYTHTSIDDLVRVTGASRGSLYQTWGDKRGILLAAIERYGDQVLEQLVEALESGDPLEQIHAVFWALADLAFQTNGCLVLNTALEPIVTDPAVAHVTRTQLDRVRGALLAALVRAQVADPEAHADHLAMAVQAIRVQAATRPPRAALDNFVRLTLSTLPSPPTGGTP